MERNGNYRGRNRSRRIAGQSVAVSAGTTAELSAWLAKYEPVEREIMEARERRLARRKAKEERETEARRKCFGDLCEATEGFAVVWRREGWAVRDMIEWADGDVLTLWALARWIRREATECIDRARDTLKRPIYYEREKARRQALAEERKRTRQRCSSNPCPTREQVLDAWVHRRESQEAAVRFGSMMQDLECYLDNSLMRDESGTIIGRRAGIKGWLQENIPALFVRYTTVMRYKAMAKRLRQIVGLADPVPVEVVLADAGKTERAGSGAGTVTDGETPAVEIVRARAVWLEVVHGVAENPTALMARIDALLDPNRVEDANMLAAWRTKYGNEITVRRKSHWWKKMNGKAEAAG